MIRTKITPCSSPVGEPLEIAIGRHPQAKQISRANITLYELGELETFWKLNTTLDVQHRDEELVAVLMHTAGLEPDHFYELRSVELRQEDTIIERLTPAVDDRVFFQIHDIGQPPIPCSEVKRRALDIEEQRRQLFARPLGDPSVARATQYRAVSLVERLLLTRPMSIPSCQIVPMPSDRLTAVEAEAFNAVLGQLGWRARLDISQWVARMAPEQPLVAFVFPRIQAATPEQAAALARNARDRLVDLLALHRGAAGVPLITLVEETATFQGCAFREGGIYTGNLLGGFVSGENPTALIGHYQAIERNGPLALWVSLARDAEAEQRVDFAFARFWTVMEAMADDRVATGRPVTDFQGQPLTTLTKDGQTRQRNTSDSPTVRAYHLLKARATLARVSGEQNFVGPRPGETLWETVSAWYGFRNAAMHYGGFSPTDSRQQQQPWFQATLDAHNYVQTQDPAAATHPASHPYVRGLRDAVRLLLLWELGDAASAGWRTVPIF